MKEKTKFRLTVVAGFAAVYALIGAGVWAFCKCEEDEKRDKSLIERCIEKAAGEDGILSVEESRDLAKGLGEKILYGNDRSILHYVEYKPKGYDFYGTRLSIYNGDLLRKTNDSITPTQMKRYLSKLPKKPGFIKKNK